MAVNDETSHMVDELDDNNHKRVLATDLRVGASGRLTIPEGKRERYGIEQGDFIDAVFIVEDKGGEEDA